ncbi:uncharacterized protein LOC141672813 [Apium graveolens]|uniref:uncharacterized protein LOC141672813 n=1 Tax=Apium graveolens TaxID=4045 RepID=UPI003D7A8C7D
MGFDEDDSWGLVPKFGAIFMSNSATKKECLKRKIFGLPMAKANFVKRVKSGMILFLFEFEKRELYGVFQATSDGTMNLNPRAFTSSGKQFPAQVQIAVIWSCHPLPESVFRDAIKENYYSPNKFHFGLSAQQVRALLHLCYSRRLEEGKATLDRSLGMGTKKRKLDDHGRFPSHDDSESEILDNRRSWHATSTDYGGDTLGTINSAVDGMFLLNRRFSTAPIGNSLLGSVGADREPLVIEDRFKCVNNNGGVIEPDFLPVFPSYFTSSEDIVVADDYRFSKGDRIENACDVESCIKPNFASGLTSNDAPDRTVPYDPEFPDIRYRCSSQILDSAQGLSSLQVPDENFLPLSTSECATHEAPLVSLHSEAPIGSLYSEVPVVKASVFSRLSVPPRKHKREKISIQDKDDRLASIDEVMDSLHQAHNRWVKGSVGAKSRYVYVRCEEESKYLNQLQVEQPVVTKEVTADVDCLVNEEYGVPKETRVVDFKRRSEKNKYLNEMVFKDSAGTTMDRTSRTTVDATDNDLVGKAGKKRKLIRPDFRKEQSNGRGDILEKFEVKEKIDEMNFQVVSGANDSEQKSSFQLGSEYQANLPFQDLASSLASGSSAQEQLSLISGVAAVSRNLEEGETADINHQLSGNVDITVEHKCSLQSLQLESENQVSSSMQDLASSLASSSSAQEQPSSINEITSVPKYLEEEEIADLNHQVGGNVDITLEHKCSPLSLQLGSENQASLSIQDLACSLGSSSTAQEQPSFINGVSAVPKNLEEEETADIKVGGNVDIIFEHRCGVQSLQLASENQANSLIKDLASSQASGSSAQEQPSFISGVATDLKNLEGEETADINHQVGNVDINLQHECSLQSLKG